MSQANVEIVRQLLDAFTQRDRAVWLALCDPEIEWFPPADWPESAAIRGAEAVWDFTVTLDDPWEEGAYELIEVIDPENDKIAGRLRRHVRGKSSGIDAEFEYWNVVTFRGGRMIRSEWFGDRAAALEAAGLSE
jgi:ketosteroid isomerase-like protein